MTDIAMPFPATSPIHDLIRKGLILLATALTNVGVAILVHRIRQSGTAAAYIGWGTGTTAALVTQTALVTEAAPTTAGGRTLGTESTQTTDQNDDTYQLVGAVTATGAAAITETGMFDAAAAGSMMLRANFAAVNVAVLDSILFTFRLKFLPIVV